MRLSTILLLTVFTISASGQRLTGEYHDYFGHKLNLKNDSTFKYEWHFDLIHTWALGQWTVKNDTIHLKFKDFMIYDTLVRPNKPDSLVKSLDEKASKINQEEFAMLQAMSGGQSSEGITNRLFHKRKRLYLVSSNGKLSKEKFRGIWSKKKWPTWYMKSD